GPQRSTAVQRLSKGSRVSSSSWCFLLTGFIYPVKSMVRYWRNEYDRLERLPSGRKKAPESPNHSLHPSAPLARAGDIRITRRSAIMNMGEHEGFFTRG